MGITFENQPSLDDSGGISIGGGIEISDKPIIVWSESTYTIPGTYTWTCPNDVTSVDVVCVGGGGSGSAGYNNGNVGTGQYTGGGGAGLGWKNNIAVTPGQTYVVVVGAGGTAVTANTTPPLYYGYVRGYNGGNSYFLNTNTVMGIGGDGGGKSGSNFANANGGGYVGDGGGYGGNGEFITILTQFGPQRSAMGGGAGGYTGNGGSQSTGLLGVGGGGDGGTLGATPGSAGESGNGVGIYGINTKGIDSTGNDAGIHGGGGSGSEQGTGKAGADGAVRIIWGSDRNFPNTNVDFLQGNKKLVSSNSTIKIDFADKRSYGINGYVYDTTIGGNPQIAITSAAYENNYGGVLSFADIDPGSGYFFIFTGSVPSLPFTLDSVTPKTIQMWIRFNKNISDNTVIFAYSDAQFGGNDYGYTLRAFANNSLAFMYKFSPDANNVPYTRVYSSANVISPNNWYMITFTSLLSATTNTTQVFLNDSALPVINCATGLKTFTGSNTMFISDSYFSNANAMNASVGSFLVYNKELSHAERVQNYDATKNRFLYSSG